MKAYINKRKQKKVITLNNLKPIDEISLHTTKVFAKAGLGQFSAT